MQALNVIGDVSGVIQALRIIDECGYYHHAKLISDGLLNFSGSWERLFQMLWQEFPSFSESMQIAVLDYFRFSSGGHGERILRLLISENRTNEVAYSCMQFIVDAKTGQIKGAEALSRWHNSEDSVLFPTRYIDAMSTSGIIERLDFHIFEEVCQQLEKWSQTDKRHFIYGFPVISREPPFPKGIFLSTLKK